MPTYPEMANDKKPTSHQIQIIMKALKKKKKIDDEKAEIEERLSQLNLLDQEVNQKLYLFAQVPVELDERNTSGSDER